MIKTKLIFISKYEDYFEEVLEFIEECEAKIVYITLNKSQEYLIEMFVKEKFDKKRFYFIDGITGVLTKPDKSINTCFVKPALDLDDIENCFKNIVPEGEVRIILDSVSDIIDRGVDSKKICGFISFIVQKANNGIIVFAKKEDEQELADSGCISAFNAYKKSFVPLGFSN